MISLLINDAHKDDTVDAHIEHDKNSVFIKEELDDTVEVNIELDINSVLINKERKDGAVDSQNGPGNSIFIKEELDTVVEIMDVDQNLLIINNNGLNQALSLENQIIGTEDSMAELVLRKVLLQDNLVSEC